PALVEPALERQDALLLGLEALLAVGRAVRPARHHRRSHPGLLPAGLEPVLEQHRGRRALGLGRALDAHDEAAARRRLIAAVRRRVGEAALDRGVARSEEHTSEL